MGLWMEGVPAVLSFIQRDTLSFWCNIIEMLPSLLSLSPRKEAGAWRTVFCLRGYGLDSCPRNERLHRAVTKPPSQPVIPAPVFADCLLTQHKCYFYITVPCADSCCSLVYPAGFLVMLSRVNTVYCIPNDDGCL